MTNFCLHAVNSRFFKLNYMHNYHLSYMSSSSVPLICHKRSLNWTMSLEWDSKICSLMSQQVWHVKRYDPSIHRGHKAWAKIYIFCRRSLNLSLCHKHVKIFEWDAKKSTTNQPFSHTSTFIRLNMHTAIHM